MTKGLLIFFIVLIVISIIHFISLRIIRVAEEKKWNTERYFGIFMDFFLPLVDL